MLAMWTIRHFVCGLKWFFESNATLRYPSCTVRLAYAEIMELSGDSSRSEVHELKTLTCTASLR
jgi:hypothetical protein